MYFYMFYLYHKKAVNSLAKIPILSDRVKSLIKENGLTMRFFNDMFGKNRSFLSNVLSGSDSITESQLSFLADKLNTTPEYLKGETDQKEKPATETGSGLSDYDSRVLAWFYSLPPEKRKAILEIGDGPKE